MYVVAFRCNTGFVVVAAARVIDQNDHTPTFSQAVYTATIVENSPPGQTLLRVSAVDGDVGPNAEITYLLDGDPDGLLTVDPVLGVVSSAAELNLEEPRQLVTATVVAVDGGVPRRSSTAEIFLRVVDVDDEQPLTFSRPRYTFRVAENQPAGVVVGRVAAHDLDVRSAGRPQLRYGLEATEDSRMFFVDRETGAVVANASLDYESRRQYRLLVSAVELGRPDFTALCDVVVTVDDVNDHRPRFAFPSPAGDDQVTLEVDGGLPVDEVVCTLTAHDRDEGDNGRMAFALVSDHASDLVDFDLDPVSGQLRLVAEQLPVRAARCKFPRSLLYPGFAIVKVKVARLI